MQPHYSTNSYIRNFIDSYKFAAIAAGLTTNMIANMGKEGKNISLDTLVRICETLDCGILDVIELASDESSVINTEKGKNNKKNNKKWN